MRTIRFYYDYLSPYAYLAWTQLPALAERHAAEVDPRAIVFGKLLDANGTRGPAEIPARRRYLIRDLARIAHRFGVPLVPPPAHPFNPLLALRVTYLAEPGAQRRALIDACYRAVWVTGQGVTEPAIVDALAAAVGIADAAARAATMKDRLRAETDEAIALGLFGVPTMLVEDQMFWGCDALPHLEHYLAHGDVVPAATVAAWEALPAGAVRTRAGG